MQSRARRDVPALLPPHCLPRLDVRNAHRGRRSAQSRRISAPQGRHFAREAPPRAVEKSSLPEEANKLVRVLALSALPQLISSQISAWSHRRYLVANFFLLTSDRFAKKILSHDHRRSVGSGRDARSVGPRPSWSGSSSSASPRPGRGGTRRRSSWRWWRGVRSVMRRWRRGWRHSSRSLTGCPRSLWFEVWNQGPSLRL